MFIIIAGIYLSLYYNIINNIIDTQRYNKIQNRYKHIFRESRRYKAETPCPMRNFLREKGNELNAYLSAADQTLVRPHLNKWKAIQKERG